LSDVTKCTSSTIADLGVISVLDGIHAASKTTHAFCDRMTLPDNSQTINQTKKHFKLFQVLVLSQSSDSFLTTVVTGHYHNVFISFIEKFSHNYFPEAYQSNLKITSRS
jgi:hypothetical protein